MGMAILLNGLSPYKDNEELIGSIQDLSSHKLSFLVYRVAAVNAVIVFDSLQACYFKPHPYRVCVSYKKVPLALRFASSDCGNRGG